MKKTLITLVILGLVLVGVSFMPNTLPTVYHATGLNDHYDFKGKTFQEYITHETAKIKAARTKSGANASDEVVDGNAPFEIIPENAPLGEEKKYKQAVVMAHGLTASPFVMKEIAQFYASKGFVVRTILLTGHGTVVGDLLNVTHEDWIQTLKFAIDSTRDIADDVHLVGYSTGGALALLEVYQRPYIKSVALFSPLIKINSGVDFLTPFLNVITRINYRTRWFAIDKETNPYQYYSLPINGIARPYQLTEMLKKFRQRKKLETPIFIAASHQDSVVSSEHTLKFFSELDNDKNRMLLFTNTGYDSNDQRILPIDTKGISPQIISFSHVSLLSHPTNPVYGMLGKAKLCFGYEEGTPQHDKCMSGNLKDLEFGETTYQTPESKEVVRRLTFNPKFSEMLEHLDKFLSVIH